MSELECPRCGSNNIGQLDFDKELGETVVACGKCGTTGAISEFQEEEDEELETAGVCEGCHVPLKKGVGDTFCPECRKVMAEEGDDGDERWDGGTT